MPSKSLKRKKTDAMKEYQRSLAAVRESGTSKDAKDFDKAFKKVVSKK